MGTYGSSGEYIAGVTSNLPGYASVSTTGIGPYVHTSEVNRLAALQKPGGGTIADEFYDPVGFGINLRLTDGKTHQVALYLADFDGQNRDETVQVWAGSKALTSAINISGFTGGDFVVFDISGNVTIRFTHVSGGSAVVDALFLAPTPTPAGTAAYVKTDVRTHGRWMGTYGSSGEYIVGVAGNLPGYASVSTTGIGPYVHTSAVNPLAPLQKPGGGTIADEFYNAVGFNVSLNLTGGGVHQVAIYMADFDGQNRTETVQAFGAGNKALTAAISITGFTGGDYVVFDVSGNVTFHFAHVSGGSAVVDALFLDPVPTPTRTSLTPKPTPTPH